MARSFIGALPPSSAGRPPPRFAPRCPGRHGWALSFTSSKFSSSISTATCSWQVASSSALIGFGSPSGPGCRDGPQLSLSSSSSAGRPPPPPPSPLVAQQLPLALPPVGSALAGGVERLDRPRISFWTLMPWARSFLEALPRPLEGLLLRSPLVAQDPVAASPWLSRRLGARWSVLGGHHSRRWGDGAHFTLCGAGEGRGGGHGTLLQLPDLAEDP